MFAFFGASGASPALVLLHPMMTTLFPFTLIRRTVLCSCAALALCTVAPRAQAADLPKFSDPAVNDFVKKYDDLISTMVKDIKANDEAKMTEDGKKQDALMANTESIQGKVKPEEADAWAKFLSSEVDRLTKAMQ